jgi:two-component system, NarL family, invasion response regulator UvrY
MFRILIVDDHPIVRFGLKEILGDERDIAVSEAANSREALRLIGEHSWDLAVLDLDLPGKSGLDLLKEMKQRRHCPPVLILSVYPEEQFAVRTLRAGASGFLSKESAPENLVKAVRKILNGGRYFSELVADKLLSRPNDQAVTGYPHEALSDREFQILCLLGAGKAVKEISRELSLSAPTVSTYRARILEKMGMRTTAQLVHYAVTNRLVT